MKKEKKRIAPNECSLIRWILAAVVGYLLAAVAAVPIQVWLLLNPQIMAASFMGIEVESIFDIFAFVFFFWGTALALKWIAKTSLKDFILGVGGKINKKECWILCGLQTVGVLASFLITFQNVHLRGISAGTSAALMIFMLLLCWMQTTWEELIFRGLFIRWACGNKIGFTKKALFAGVLSSVIFGLMHISNPEISSMTGFELVLGVACYILPGAVLYLADIYFGSLLPGILLHWTNNFLLFTLISVEVSVASVPTLLVDTTPVTAVNALVTTLIADAPVVAYILWDYRKRRKAAAAREAGSPEA